MLNMTDSTVFKSREVGLILQTTGNRANVLIHGEEFHLAIPGRWRLDRDGIHPLAPGDRISLEPAPGGWKIIESLPRQNEFTRQTPGIKKPLPQTMAVNLDQVMVVASAKNPVTPTGLIDRLLVTAALGSVPAVLLINKIDLASKEKLDSLKSAYRKAVETTILTSAVTGEGIDALSTLLVDRITLLAGSSGVGKSTLANRVDSELNLKTGEISQATGKGRHITSAARLHFIRPNGWVIDTPGLRECAPWNMSSRALGSCFPEFRELSFDCRFRDCLHATETGCAVRQAVTDGIIPMERYKSYLKLLKETVG